jgi:hypothetical protein
MKYIFVLFAFLKLSIGVYAQNIQTITVSRCSLMASIPNGGTTYVDTLGVIMYSSISRDSTVGAQLFVYENFSLDSNEVLNVYMQENNETDTLKTIAKYMVAVAEGQLVYFNIIDNLPGRKTMDVGIAYQEGSTNFITFTRYVIRGKRLAILNLFAQIDYLNNLMEYRTLCFNNLILY